MVAPLSDVIDRDGPETTLNRPLFVMINDSLNVIPMSRSASSKRVMTMTGPSPNAMTSIRPRLESNLLPTLDVCAIGHPISENTA